MMKDNLLIFLFAANDGRVLNPDEVNLPRNPATGENLVDILNILFAIMGAAAVLVIILAALSMVTSQGDPNSLSRARNTILYAFIGLVIIILSGIITNFVIDRLG